MTLLIQQRHFPHDDLPGRERMHVDAAMHSVEEAVIQLTCGGWVPRRAEAGRMLSMGCVLAVGTVLPVWVVAGLTFCIDISLADHAS